MDMTMEDRELFRSALGLESPWQVETLEFSVNDNRLDITLDFPRGSRFPCPECGKMCGVHDTDQRTWRHLNFFQHETHLHARLPRVKCPDHQVKTTNVPWSRPGSHFTLLFEALVMVMARNGLTANAISRLVGEHDTRIWRILHHYTDEARAKLDMSKVSEVGVDKTSKSKGHNYVTVFMDLEERRVLFATEGKDAETITAFKSDLEAHGGKAEEVKAMPAAGRNFARTCPLPSKAGSKRRFPMRRSPSINSI